MIKLYKPSIITILTDVFLYILSLFIILQWFPLTTKTPYEKYDVAAILFYILWLVFSYLFKRYKVLHRQTYFRSCFRLFYASLLSYLTSVAILSTYNPDNYSSKVLLTFIIILFIINLILYHVYYALLYAVEYFEKEDNPIVREKRENAIVRLQPDLDEENYNELCKSIYSYSGEKVLRFLSIFTQLNSGNNSINFTYNYFDIKSKQRYLFSTFVLLGRLNDIKGINKIFAEINHKLPDDGQLICCFESKSTRKGKLLNRYWKLIDYVIYTIDFILKRFIPKIFLLRKLYFDITKGKNRILSKTEILGRLYATGFEVVHERKIDQLIYVVAKRVKDPEIVDSKNYGPFIKLKRLGKNGKIFEVYKMRTMHPYSEYLQAFIYERNHLKEGGKFNKDIRISTLGKLMRKFWLDELPMIFNLLKGEMKLVGVRPLSSHYFSLYSKELQEKRLLFKPGLLPPFYAHLPNTMEEIQASEMQYLLECESKGIIKTDTKYFFLILKNILFNKARSA